MLSKSCKTIFFHPFPPAAALSLLPQTFHWKGMVDELGEQLNVFD